MARAHLIDSLFAAQAKRKKPEASTATENMVAMMQDHQRALRDDPALRISLIAPRQTGKSLGTLLLVCSYCTERPDQEWVIIGLTLKAVKRVFWKPFLQLNKRFSLGLVLNKTDMTVSFPNGSIIYLVGGDKAEETEKLRGGRYNGVVVDECASYPLADFQYMIEAILEPALAVLNGKLILIGTPGEVLLGEFYRATCTPPIQLPSGLATNAPYADYDETKAVWSLHRWTVEDNRAVPHLWKKFLKMKESRGWKDDHPTWRREYLGFWVANIDVLVYRFHEEKNTYRADGEGPWGLPKSDEPWRTVLGVDLGETDGTAMVVWAYTAGLPALYEVYSKKVTKAEVVINASFIASWYNQLARDYGPFEAEIVDMAGLASLLVNTLYDDYGISWEPAEKKEKNDHIELLNTDFDCGRVFLLSGSPLAREMQRNRWLPDEKASLGQEVKVLPPKSKRREDPKTPNDLCDAALYAFRFAAHRRYRPPEEVVQQTWLDYQLAQEAEALNKLRISVLGKAKRYLS